MGARVPPDLPRSTEVLSGAPTYVRGLVGQALRLHGRLEYPNDGLPLDGASDFSIEFWVRTTAAADKRMVLLSRKDFPDNSLHSQKRPGWVFHLSHGTWAWNMGSGDRRITHERDNGEFMPLNDGRLAPARHDLRSLRR